jgi:hypothetical protein
MDQIIASLEPIPTLEEVLELVHDPSQRPEIPVLPPDVAKEVEELERRIGDLNNLATLLQVHGDQAGAEPLYRKALAMPQRPEPG